MHLRPLLTSDVRQVPDTQEVFLYPNSSASIIVEILQRVEPVHFEDAIKLNSPCHSSCFFDRLISR